MITTNENPITRMIEAALFSDAEVNRRGEVANVVDGLFEIARAIDGLATQVKYLGTGDAGTTIGAIEFLGASVEKGMNGIAVALSEIAQSHE